jgi:hypothetical protein
VDAGGLHLGSRQDRDGPFGDGRARVNGPEKRDAAGRLLP